MADDPSTPSGDHAAMQPFWAMVNAILGGAPAMRHATHSRSSGGASVATPLSSRDELYDRAADGSTPTVSNIIRPHTWNESPYLPKFENEDPVQYERRRCHAPFTNLYADISDNLASKPFSKELGLDDKEPDNLKALAEDIDGQGNSLHTFASDLFHCGLDKGIHWILIDYTKIDPSATLADERAANARPYWVSINAENMLAVHSTFLNGKQTIYNARIYEPSVRMDGYGETSVERVRVLSREPTYDAAGNIIALAPAMWELYEKVTNGKEAAWVSVGSGPITIGEIPLVPFVPGGREGASWKVCPPLADLAYMQVEEFQQESNLKAIKELTAFPMLAGNGVQNTNASGDPVRVPVGPRAVLFAPPGVDGNHGEWTFIEPTAASLTFLQADLEKHRTEMRNLGRQPLSAANLTVVTTANVAAKAHNAVQAWALLLKDALEQAWVFTCKWLRMDHQPVVLVHTDFGVDFQADTELTALQAAEAAGVISKKLLFAELKRRGVLSDDADYADDQEEMASQQQGLQPEVPIDPVTGKPIPPDKPPQGGQGGAPLMAA